MCVPNGGRDSFKGVFGMALRQWHQYLFKAALRSWAVLTLPALLLGCVRLGTPGCAVKHKILSGLWDLITAAQRPALLKCSSTG